MLKLKILGMGCPNCDRLTASTRAVADDLGLAYDLEKVTELARFAEFGVMITPALVVDGKLVAAGRVPPEGELRELLTRASA